MAITFEKKRGIRADLVTAIWLGPQLELVITRQSKASGLSEGIGKSNDTPLYFNEGASDAQRLLRTVLVKWCWAVWCECRVPFSRCHGFDSVRYITRSKSKTEDIAAWLLERMHQLDNESCADEIQEAVRTAMQAVDSPPKRIYLGDCPCGRKLYGDPDMVETECPACLILHRTDALRVANRQRGRELLVSSKEAAQYMGEVFGVQITDSRIRKWASRGKLDRYPVAERICFKLGDIIDLCKRGVGTSQDRV